jgi:Dual specificity phosphatase, catalytic domain
MSDNKYPSKILGYLYLGGKQDAKAKNLLVQLKIKYILNVTPPRSLDPESGCPSFFEKDKTFVYKRIPVFDNRGEDLLQYMEQSYRFIEEGKHYGGVLVHCHKGVSRSSTFVLGYLMKKNSMTLDEALEYVKTIRPIVMPNLAFMAQLRAYETTLDKERQNSVECFDKEESREPTACSSSGPRVTTMGPSLGPSIGPSFPSEVSAPLPDIATDLPSSNPRACSIGPSLGPSFGPSFPPQESSTALVMAELRAENVGRRIGPVTGPSIELSRETPIIPDVLEEIAKPETSRSIGVDDMASGQDKKRAKHSSET